MVEAGEITPPPKGGYLQGAFDAINDLQTEYAFPYRQTTKRRFTDSDGNKVKQVVLGLFDAKMAGEAGFFQSLKGYRSDENFEGIQSVEEHAKIILQQLVNHELTKMGKRMVNNMRQYGFNPVIFDLDYFIFSELSAGGESLNFAGPEVVEQIVDLPDQSDTGGHPAGGPWPGPYYTSGGQFRVAINKDTGNEFNYGDEYVGYYHGHIDEDGDVVYMVGEYHLEEAHDVLTPIDDLITVATEGYNVKRQEVDKGVSSSPASYADITDGEEYQRALRSQSSPYPKIETTIVPLGTVADLGTAPTGTGKMYTLEQYISIDGVKYSPTVAQSIIKSKPRGTRISDAYPGTLRLIYPPEGAPNADEPVGAAGRIGVRHGLNFYFSGGGGKTLITSV